MRTTVDIDAHLLRRLRVEAERRGIPLKDALAGALRRGLDLSLKGEKRSPYEGPSYAMGARIDVEYALTIAGELEDEETMKAMRRFGALPEARRRS